MGRPKGSTNKKDLLYSAMLEANDTEYTGKADVLSDAINQIKLPFIKTKGNLIVRKGVLRSVKFLPLKLLRRYFMHENKTSLLAKQVLAKNMELILK